MTTSAGRMSVRDKSASTQPGITWLTAVTYVRGPCSGGRARRARRLCGTPHAPAHRCDRGRPDRPCWTPCPRARPSGDPHGVVSAVEEGALRADAHRKGQPGELAGGLGLFATRATSSRSASGHCALEPDPRAPRVVRPAHDRGGRRWGHRGRRPRASRPRGRGRPVDRRAGARRPHRGSTRPPTSTIDR